MDTWERFSRALEESKQAKKLDPVGKEDGDVNNNGIENDSSDKYLKNRRLAVKDAIESDRKKKSQSKSSDTDDMCESNDGNLANNYPPYDKVTRGDVIAGATGKDQMGGKKKKKVRVEEDCGCEDSNEKEDKKVKEIGPEEMRTRINLAKTKLRTMGLRMSHELEGDQLDEIAPLVVGAGLAAAAAAPYLAKKFLAPKVNQALDNATKSNKLPLASGGNMQQLRQAKQAAGMKEDIELVDEGKADKKLPEHKRSAARLARYDNPSGALALGGGQQRARRAEHEERRGVKKEEFVGEDKEYRREMAKAAARERAEERREKGSKAAKSPGREGPSAGKSYADYQEISIKAHDKLTKKNKNVVGLVAKEEVEQLDEMPYQVYGSPDGKSEKKIGKLVKSKKYAHDRAEELADTHKETGGKYRVQKEENEIEEGMSMKDFKANRKKLQRKEATADARKRGHEGKTWADSGRTYSADEAKSRREKMSDLDRSQRYRVANDPDSEHDDYPSDRTKSPKKLRKQKAMGELGEGYIEEKALSRAQQRFMGMVYAAKKGETPASPEVAKAAEGMSKKSAKDFAKTKHAGLPEKKEEVKEELSLVERILDEAIKGTVAGGKSRAKKYKAQAKDVRIRQIGSAALSGDDEQVKKLKAAKTTVKIKNDSSESEPESEKKEKPKSKKGRGKSDPSALARRAAIAGALKLKSEKEKTKRQREREKNRQSIGPTRLEPISYRDKGGTAMSKALGNLGSVIGTGIKTAAVVSSRLHQKRKEQKQKEQKEKVQKEGFISEVEDLAVNTKNNSPKIIDVSNKKNKIEINPKIDEQLSNWRQDLGEDWQSVNRKDKTDGLSQKAVNAYRRENPGSKLQTAVTEKKPTGKRAARRKSFCSRMKGMKDRLTSAETARDPDSRINKALRRWNCH